MPELPEVETTGRGLAQALLDKVLVKVEARRANLRTPIPPTLQKRLGGAMLQEVTRRAKYLLLRFDNGETLLIHLGMSGRLAVAPMPPTLEKHDHLILYFAKGQTLVFNDARRFGRVEIMKTSAETSHALLKNLGPEPLLQTFTPTVLAEKLTGKKTAIKLALLDQTVVAGIGNIYASEALFHAGIHPEAVAGSISLHRLKNLVPAIQRVLEEAIEAGGSTLRDYRQTSGELGFYQNRFAVYGRAGHPCPNCTCTSSIQQLIQGGRSTFFCPLQKI